MSKPNKLRATLDLIRYPQWIKNGFVFAAPLFAKRLADPETVLPLIGTFLSFCLVSSAVYLLNDMADIEQDKVHPTKCNRPLAAGILSIGFAQFLMIALLGTSLVISWATASLATTGVILTYFVANILYSHLLKHIVILDVAFIAVGFILRILAGAVATEVVPSYWIILCTFNVSLFLGFVKRRAELIALENDADEHRKVLEHYSHDFIDQMVSIVTSTTVVCYILYTVDTRTVEYFGGQGLVFTVPFVLYGIFRYLYISYHRDEGGSPSRAVLIDLPFLLNGILFGVTCIVVIYWDTISALYTT